MQGEIATIKDIVLDMCEIVIGSDLLCAEESLSSDSEEEHELFKIDTGCDNCKTGIRVCVRSSNRGIRHLQNLLNKEVSFLCPGCSRNLFRHGRSH
ncbi:E7 [Gammapapillomavirus 24]|uniref:Protein E7 n=1 Tax=Gammapapillomavirus 24 TaxID=1961681 RepID=A0A2D2AMA8_9PAPI|nr:E7 [Gammapapillomavirus 24]